MYGMFCSIENSYDAIFYRSVWAATVPGGGPLLGEAVVDQATV